MVGDSLDAVIYSWGALVGKINKQRGEMVGRSTTTGTSGHLAVSRAGPKLVLLQSMEEDEGG